MDYLRRRSRFKQIKYKLKQTADRFSDDEFEALCHKELFRIIGETLSEMPALQQEVFLDIHINLSSGFVVKHQLLQQNVGEAVDSQILSISQVAHDIRQVALTPSKR